MTTTPEFKRFDKPDQTLPFDRGHIHLVTLNEMTVCQVTFEPGWRWSECIKPTAGTDSCRASHFGFGLSGRLRVRMDDGTEFETGPGEVGVIPPGHDAWVVGDEPYVGVDFALGEYVAADVDSPIGHKA